MVPMLGPHLLEPELEAYSMGTLSEDRMDVFEEHLLACADCQDRLLEIESFVNAMRSVSPKLRMARQPFWARLFGDLFRWPRVALSVALVATATVLVVLLPRITAPPEPVQMAALTLRASRGAEGLAAAPAGKPLSLTVDLTELPAFPSYKLAIVGAMGAQVWESQAFPENRKLVVSIAKGLPPGQYYVRLYAPASELLREFSLALK